MPFVNPEAKKLGIIRSMSDVSALEKILTPDLGKIEVTAAHDARRLEIWRHCVLHFPFSMGNLQWSAASAPITELPESLEDWLTLTLRGDRYQFEALLPLTFFETALATRYPHVNLRALAEPDRQLIYEELLSDPLTQMEHFLGEYQEIIQARGAVWDDVRSNSLQFSVENHESRFTGFLNITDPLAERITERVIPFSSVDEKQVSNHLKVMIGPIAIDNHAFSNVTLGQIIDCGVQPNDTIRGFIWRSDDTYWPGFVEDDQFLISGKKSPIDFSAARKADKTLASLQFADANVTAIDRLTINEGDRINVNRFENNEVRIFANDIEHAFGRLLIHNGNLAVEVTYLKGTE